MYLSQPIYLAARFITLETGANALFTVFMAFRDFLLRLILSYSNSFVFY